MIDYDKCRDEWYEMKQYGPIGKFTRHLFLRILDRINFNSVVDIGCAEGAFLKDIMKHYPNIKTFGVDISKNVIAETKKEMPDAAFCVLDIQKEGLASKYDLVTAIALLEHLDNVIQALKNMHEMCEHYLLLTTLQGKKSVGHKRTYNRKNLVKI